MLQLLAYMETFTFWPAMEGKFLRLLEEAITLDEVAKTVLNHGKTKFEISSQIQKDTFLIEQGITDESVLLSLGIFVIAFAIIVFLVAFFGLLWLVLKNLSCCGKLSN